MSEPGNEVGPEEVVQFETPSARLRTLAAQLVPDDRERTAAYVSAQLPDQPEGVNAVCTSYFAETVPGGERTYGDLVLSIRERSVPAETVFTAVSTVQAALISGDYPEGIMPTAGAEQALARVVVTDTAALSARLAGQGSGGEGRDSWSISA